MSETNRFENGNSKNGKHNAIMLRSNVQRDIVYVHATFVASAVVVSLVVVTAASDDDDDAAVSLPGMKSEKCAI